MDVIKIEVDWYFELNVNYKLVYLSIVFYIFVVGGS